VRQTNCRHYTVDLQRRSPPPRGLQPSFGIRRRPGRAANQFPTRRRSPIGDQTGELSTGIEVVSACNDLMEAAEVLSVEHARLRRGRRSRRRDRGLAGSMVPRSRSAVRTRFSFRV
jgi:hypothetical protein